MSLIRIEINGAPTRHQNRNKSKRKTLNEYQDDVDDYHIGNNEHNNNQNIQFPQQFVRLSPSIISEDSYDKHKKKSVKIKNRKPSLKRLSQQSMPDKSYRRLSNTSAFWSCNSNFPRKTCKMFQLNHTSDHIQSRRTLNKLLLNLETSKFNVIQQPKTYQKQNQKYFKAYGFKLRQNQSESKKSKKKSTQPKVKMNSKRLKRSQRMPRKSRFSIQIKNMSPNKFNQEDAKKDIDQDKKDKQITKFIEIQNLLNETNKNTTLKWDKNWRFQQKNNNIKLTTQKISAKVSKRNSQKKIFYQKIQLKQRQLKKLQSKYKQIRKLKNNQTIMKSIKQSGENKIKQFFDNLQVQLIKCSKTFDIYNVKSLRQSYN